MDIDADVALKFGANSRTCSAPEALPVKHHCSLQAWPALFARAGGFRQAMSFGDRLGRAPRRVSRTTPAATVTAATTATTKTATATATKTATATATVATATAATATATTTTATAATAATATATVATSATATVATSATATEAHIAAGDDGDDNGDSDNTASGYDSGVDEKKSRFGGFDRPRARAAYERAAAFVRRFRRFPTGCMRDCALDRDAGRMSTWIAREQNYYHSFSRRHQTLLNELAIAAGVPGWFKSGMAFGKKKWWTALGELRTYVDRHKSLPAFRYVSAQNIRLRRWLYYTKYMRTLPLTERERAAIAPFVAMMPQ